MKVFKFGGASVKDAEGVKNVATIINRFPGEQLVIVVSAMGKSKCIRGNCSKCI